MNIKTSITIDQNKLKPGSISSKISISRICIHLLFIVVSILAIGPMLLILSSSFTDEIEVIKNGYTIFPKVFSVSAYEYVLRDPTIILKAYGVTILVTVAGTITSVLVTTMLAYVLSRQDFLAGKIISFMVVFSMMFNGGLVPSYILITKYLKLKDSLLALILPMVVIPWFIFLMRGLLGKIPISLIEAAHIDGANELKIFASIILPISKPAIATLAVFTSFTYWNDWFLALLYIDNPNLAPLQLLLQRVMNFAQFVRNSPGLAVNIDFSKLPAQTARMATCVLVAGPILLVFPFFQKHFVRGLTGGAIKG